MEIFLLIVGPPAFLLGLVYVLSVLLNKKKKEAAEQFREDLARFYTLSAVRETEYRYSNSSDAVVEGNVCLAGEKLAKFEGELIKNHMKSCHE